MVALSFLMAIISLFVLINSRDIIYDVSCNVFECCLFFIGFTFTLCATVHIVTTVFKEI